MNISNMGAVHEARVEVLLDAVCEYADSIRNQAAHIELFAADGDVRGVGRQTAIMIRIAVELGETCKEILTVKNGGADELP